MLVFKLLISRSRIGDATGARGARGARGGIFPRVLLRAK